MAGTSRVYEFGPYSLDVEERRLCNAGDIVPLAPKAFDVLVTLGLVHLAVAPQWDCLRGSERFGERLQAMGLAAAADRAERFLQ